MNKFINKEFKIFYVDSDEQVLMKKRSKLNNMIMFFSGIIFMFSN